MFQNGDFAGRRVVFGIGVFDGVHRGHRMLMDTVCRMARACSAVPVAVTFAPHPRQILCPEHPPRLLISLQERIRFLKESGAEEVAVIPFTRELAVLPPATFLERLADFNGTLCGICVGANWHFGAKAAGNMADLQKFAVERNVAFEPVPELEWHGETVSSTRIRRAVASGRLQEASEMLGRPYRLTGIVVHGYRAATNDLACPTANLVPEEGIWPPDGVYAAKAFLPDGSVYWSAVNLGISPTYRRPGGERRMELHLLDYSGDLYGKDLSVEFIRCLRPERAFPDTEALRKQIMADIAEIRKLQYGK